MPHDQQFAPIVDGARALPGRNYLGHLDEAQWEKDDQGQPRDPWSFGYMLAMRDAATGEDCTFSTSSWGGQRAVRSLFGAFANERLKHPGMHPVVQLGQEAKSHKKYGSVLEPKFPIVDWRPWDADGDADLGLLVMYRRLTAQVTTETLKSRSKHRPAREERASFF